MHSKKTSRICFSDKEDKFSDGSTRGSTDYSESNSITFCKQKSKETIQNPSIKSKNGRKFIATHQTQHTFEKPNPIYSAPSHVITTPAVSNKEPFKNVPKKSKSPSQTKKKIVCNEKTVKLSYHEDDSFAPKHGSKSSFLTNDMKSEQSVAKCSSLTDIRRNEKGDFISPYPSLQNIFSLTPSQTTNFEKGADSNRQKSYLDSMKEFDLIWNSNLFNQWEKSLLSSQKGVLTTVPKLSTSKPFILKRRTYSCGILSINNSTTSSSPTETSGVKKELSEALSYESDDSDVRYSSENSDICSYLNCELGSEASNDKNVFEASSSFLNAKQPIRVKYIDEITSQTKELLIYSNEFLENIRKEKGKKASKREVFEHVLGKCVDYDGESLRVILDSKDFFSKIKGIRKFQGHVKNSKDTKNIPPESLNKKVMSQRVLRSMPCWDKRQGNTAKNEEINNRNNPLIQKFCRNMNIAKKIGGSQPSLMRKNSSSINSFPYSQNRQKSLKDIRINDNHFKGVDKIEIGDGRKSRTSLKKINTEEIIASNFRSYFQFYAKLGGRLKSGAVISRMNSHFWLKKCGIIFDDISLMIADNCFSTTARRKLVLNISDYVQYLIALARRQRIFFVDVVQQLMSIDPQSVTKPQGELETNQSTLEFESVSKPQKSKQQWKENDNPFK